MTDSSTMLVGIALPTLRELRSRILASNDAEDAVAALRDAGYAGGESVYAAFEQWLAESHATSVDAGELNLDEFGEASSKFFRDAGWGDMWHCLNKIIEKEKTLYLKPKSFSLSSLSPHTFQTALSPPPHNFAICPINLPAWIP